MNNRILAFAQAFYSRENRTSTFFLLLMMLSSGIGSYFESDRPKLGATALIVAFLAAAGLFYSRLYARYLLKRTVRAEPLNDRQSRVHIMGRPMAWIGTALGLVALFVAAYAGGALYSGNFGIVVPGQVYRSAQLSDQYLRYYVQRYGIKTVINLRGANPGMHWYDKELAATHNLGIQHIDFRMSAKKDLSRQQAEDLIAILAALPKPILIHCTSGSDRTGLASALYLASIAKAGEDVAEAQLSIRYGHIALSFLPTYAMTRSWEHLEPSLGYDS